MPEEYLTKKAFDEFSEQLKYLKTVKRQEIAKAIGEAREAGDLRENAGYHEARKDQSLNEARIKELEGKLENAKIITASTKPKPKDVVILGSKVKIVNVANDRESDYTLVSDMEADILENKISNSSPLGDALLGAKKGETVEVIAPAGVIKYKIVAIA